MKKINLLAGVAFALAASAFYSPAYSADVTLCAGTAGRNYDSVMKGIGIELQNRGHNVTIKNLKGSEDILRQLDEAQAKMSLGEADCAFGVGAVPSNWALDLQNNGETVAWVYDKDINDLVVGKSSLYPPVRVARGAYSSKFDTYAIPAILFRSNKKQKNEEIDSLIKRMAPSIGAKYNTVK